MPKVSFILPAYKRRFLHEAISSILAQTYRDFELVVVDDCSPEDLKSVVDAFHDARLTYYRNEANIGGKDLVAAWNKAMMYARGEWCVLASDDDIYEPEYCEEMLKLAKRFPMVDSLHCRLVIVNENNDVLWLGKPRAEYEELIEAVYHSSVDRLDQRIPEFMYRREALVRNGGYVPSPRAWYSDIMTSIVMAKDGGVAFADKFLVRWRQSGLNISSRSDDVSDKAEATVQFLDWVGKLLSHLTPSSKSDELLLTAAREKVCEVALRSLQGYWMSIQDSKSALQILAESRLPPEVKEKWRKMRVNADLQRTKLVNKLKRVVHCVENFLCR